MEWHAASAAEIALADDLAQQHVLAHLSIAAPAGADTAESAASVGAMSGGAVSDGAVRAWRRRLQTMCAAVAALAVAMPLAPGDAPASSTTVGEFAFEVSVLLCTVTFTRILLTV